MEGMLSLTVAPIFEGSRWLKVLKKLFYVFRVLLCCAHTCWAACMHACDRSSGAGRSVPF